jgi:hypothetical protein
MLIVVAKLYYQIGLLKIPPSDRNEVNSDTRFLSKITAVISASNLNSLINNPRFLINEDT